MSFWPANAARQFRGQVVFDHLVEKPYAGASLPQLLSQSPTLSGVVFEATEGRRVLSDVRVVLDGTGGGLVETVTTLTDSDGRDVICGLDVDTSILVHASKPGYSSAGKTVVLTGDVTTFDIQLQRR